MECAIACFARVACRRGEGIAEELVLSLMPFFIIAGVSKDRLVSGVPFAGIGAIS